MNYKIVRIRLGTWRKLRGLVPGKKGESYSEYMNRVVKYISEVQDGLY